MWDLTIVLIIITQIVLLFYATIKFIVDERRNGQPNPSFPSQIKMESIPLDVSLKIIHFKKNELKLQVCLLDNNHQFRLRSFWGVNIESFHHILQSPFPWFLEAFDKGNLFGANATDILDEPKSLGQDLDETQVEVELKVPAELQLGTQAPRQKYPLVIVSTASPSSFTIIIVHLEDRSFIHLDTHILATFVKLSDNRVSRLEPIYRYFLFGQFSRKNLSNC